MRISGDETDYRRRLARVRERLAAAGADALYASAPATTAYLAGVAIMPHERLVGLIVPTDADAALVVPSLEEEHAAANPARVDVLAWDDAEGPWPVLDRAFARAPARALAIENDALTVRVFEVLRRLLDAPSFQDASPMIMDLRMRKSPAEIDALGAAAGVVDRCLHDVPPLLRAGAREVDVAYALDGLVRRFGGQGTPFDTIVLGGPNAALPHGTPGERELREGDLVVVDFGAVRDGYCADVTRTFSIGEPAGRARDIYEAVERAQRAGRDAVRNGTPCCEIDAAARSVIQDAGYGDLFLHRTGHGLGLEVHEPPSLVAGENRALELGMVVTVEPGVYVHGFGGVRLEDDVAVTDAGAEVLTTASRELIVCRP